MICDSRIVITDEILLALNEPSLSDRNFRELMRYVSDDTDTIQPVAGLELVFKIAKSSVERMRSSYRKKAERNAGYYQKIKENQDTENTESAENAENAEGDLSTVKNDSALSVPKPSQAKPSQAKPSQAKPSQAKPSQAKPSQEPPTPKGKGVRNPKVDVYAVDPDFEKLWAQHPNGKAKKDARKAWGQTAKVRPPLSEILSSHARQCSDPSWKKDGGAFVPLLATWLRGERWNDGAKRTVVPPVMRPVDESMRTPGIGGVVSLETLYAGKE